MSQLSNFLRNILILTTKLVPGECSEQHSEKNRAPKVPLHSTLPWVERVFQCLNQVMTQREVECKGHCLKEGVSVSVGVTEDGNGRIIINPTHNQKI